MKRIVDFIPIHFTYNRMHMFMNVFEWYNIHFNDQIIYKCMQFIGEREKERAKGKQEKTYANVRFSSCTNL